MQEERILGKQLLPKLWMPHGRITKGKRNRTMIKENGKIKEISENEAFCMFVDNEYYMAMDFYEIRSRLEAAGAKITKS